jgi:hypothetical protein
MNDLSNHLMNAANAARQGNVQQMVQAAMQQNPQLAQRYNMLMQRFPNMSPSQVLNTLSQRYGIDFSKFGMPIR